VAGWVRWRAGDGALPADVSSAVEVDAAPRRPAGGAAEALAQATELGVGATRLVVGAAQRAVDVVRGLISEGPAQLPRLSRLEHLDPATQISLGLMLDERAGRAPDDVVFLFGDRGYRHRDVKRRVDAVVKGLISVGIRHGDRVGVLMDTRPSAFTVVAALSRVGAIAVLLRPDGELANEAELGRITWVVSDPDHVRADSMLDGVTWCVLGGSGEGRELPSRVVDMERIDPEDVRLPGWYRANPHRAGEVAFVVFTGDGEATRAVQITNRRWALSALGTASAAALKPGDTVYSVTPIHHSSALLMSVGGAVAAGARFAMASADDPATFWEEVRRYGATHVSYTWTSLRGVTGAPPNQKEAHHPIRMFLGSGMPRALWKRVAERFATTRILEFYASAEGEAILANLSGTKAGSMGRSLPGTPEVRVVAIDLVTGELTLTPEGYGRECLADEIGLLIARVDPTDTVGGEPMRGVFTSEDAWRSTGDLFMRDQGGDLWLAGPVAETLTTAQGAVLPAGARFCLGTLPGVDLYVAYGVPDPDGTQLLVGALTLLPGAGLTTDDIDHGFSRLPQRSRPAYVQVLLSIPLTTWHRPLWRPLQAEGVPSARPDRQVWRLGADGHYLAIG
jgi:putative long chain acyl-CoA synthase